MSNTVHISNLYLQHRQRAANLSVPRAWSLNIHKKLRFWTQWPPETPGDKWERGHTTRSLSLEYKVLCIRTSSSLLLQTFAIKDSLSFFIMLANTLISTRLRALLIYSTNLSICIIEVIRKIITVYMGVIDNATRIRRGHSQLCQPWWSQVMYSWVQTRMRSMDFFRTLRCWVRVPSLFLGSLKSLKPQKKGHGQHSIRLIYLLIIP